MADAFRWLLAVDPGLDTTGVALYRLEPLYNLPLDPEVALDRLAPLLIDVTSLTPKADSPIPDRLKALSLHLREHIRRCSEVYPQLLLSRGRCIVEEPANFFNYARGGAGGPSMVKGLYNMGLASAAIILMLKDLNMQPVYVKADNTKREHKQEFAARTWDRAGRPVSLRRPGHAISDDARSAIWIGAHDLMGRPPTRTPKTKRVKKAKPEAAPVIIDLMDSLKKALGDDLPTAIHTTTQGG